MAAKKAAKKAGQHRGFDITKWQSSKPDLAIDALVETMSTDTWRSFNEVFEAFWPVYRAKNSTQLGEEMGRLRCYEKLQNMVTAGKVEKVEKEYRLKEAPAPASED